MKAEDIKAMLREDRTEWNALSATLDAHPDDVLFNPGSWNSRDIYAHLAHCMSHSISQLEAILSGTTIPATSDTEDEENARWKEEDETLSLEQAREWANKEFQRRLQLIESIAPDKWSEKLDAMARGDGADHYRDHREYIKL